MSDKKADYLLHGTAKTVLEHALKRSGLPAQSPYSNIEVSFLPSRQKIDRKPCVFLRMDGVTAQVRDIVMAALYQMGCDVRQAQTNVDLDTAPTSGTGFFFITEASLERLVGLVINKEEGKFNVMSADVQTLTNAIRWQMEKHNQVIEGRTKNTPLMMREKVQPRDVAHRQEGDVRRFLLELGIPADSFSVKGNGDQGVMVLFKPTKDMPSVDDLKRPVWALAQCLRAYGFRGIKPVSDPYIVVKGDMQAQLTRIFGVKNGALDMGGAMMTQMREEYQQFLQPVPLGRGFDETGTDFIHWAGLVERMRIESEGLEPRGRGGPA
ncbi:MAG: hypothetical protein K2Q12_08830 [Rickettsiales bacterium]|nr:hypothetical protein [Rickettsiales bacterium]